MAQTRALPPELSTDALVARALGHAKAANGVQLDPFTLLLLTWILGGVISWLVQRCLDRLSPEAIRSPNWLQRRLLSRAVWQQCQEAAKRQHAIARGWSARDIWRQHGNRLNAALLATGARLSESEARHLCGRAG